MEVTMLNNLMDANPSGSDKNEAIRNAVQRCLVSLSSWILHEIPLCLKNWSLLSGFYKANGKEW